MPPEYGPRFLAATEKILAETDKSVCAGQITIQHQRLLALSDAICRAVRINAHDAHRTCAPVRGAGPSDKALVKAVSAAARCATPSSIK